MPVMHLQTIGVTVREFEVADLDAVMQVESAAFGKHVSMTALSEQQAIELMRDSSHDTLVLQRGSLAKVVTRLSTCRPTSVVAKLTQ